MKQQDIERFRFDLARDFMFELCKHTPPLIDAAKRLSEKAVVFTDALIASLLEKETPNIEKITGIAENEHPKKKTPNKGNSHPIEVKINDKWEKFDSIKEAATRLALKPIEIRRALYDGTNIGKFKFRYYDHDLSEVLNEIDDNNKKPYQFAR